MSRYVDRTIKIDLRKLTIHEKAVMTACYIHHREQPELLIPVVKLYKLYSWVCLSLSLSVKAFREFTQYVLFQLSIYKLLKVEKARSVSKDSQIMVNIDVELIRLSLQAELGLSKFYSDE
jgi:Cdc6-like AAA superfamily ATPase